MFVPQRHCLVLIPATSTDTQRKLSRKEGASRRRAGHCSVMPVEDDAVRGHRVQVRRRNLFIPVEGDIIVSLET